jgi:hypothetical protein
VLGPGPGSFLFHGLATVSRNCLLIERHQALAQFFANASRLIREIRKPNEEKSCDGCRAAGAKKSALAKMDANGKFPRSFKPLEGVLRRPREASRAFARNAVWTASGTHGSGARRVDAAGLEDGEGIGAILFEQQKGLTGFPARHDFHNGEKRN